MELRSIPARRVPGWALDLGPVHAHPHVHAKALSAVGPVCAVGSASLDVTVSQWEGELAGRTARSATSDPILSRDRGCVNVPTGKIVGPPGVWNRCGDWPL